MLSFLHTSIWSFYDDLAIVMTSIVPSVPVADLSRCVEFYRTVLGFDLVQFSGRGADAFAVIRMGEVEMIFRSHAASRAQAYETSIDPALRIALHFLVPDAARLYRRVAGHAVLVRDYSMSLFGGHEFAIEDPNGLILLFRQRTPLDAAAASDAPSSARASSSTGSLHLAPD